LSSPEASAAAPSTMYFQHQGKSLPKNIELDINAPKELLNLDCFHKTSTARHVERTVYGRFNTAPREFFMQEAINRSGKSQPSRLFLDPYHVADGNLWTTNYDENRFQKGGMTSHAARSSQLVMQTEPPEISDPQTRARSKYVEQCRGRFVPPLKPVCSRDKGPDPYGTGKHLQWVITNSGYVGGVGTKAKTQPVWSTYSLSRQNWGPL